MKAIVWTNYGPPDVLQMQEIEKPVPKEHEVLIKIHATTVTAGDCEMRDLKFPFWLSIPFRFYIGISKPRRLTTLGQELSGVIESAGNKVTKFHPGDPVYGSTGFRLGANAEYICLAEQSEDGVLAMKPANLTFEEAAAVPTGGLEALHFLGRADISHGTKLLIIGSGGSIGTFAVQLAKHYGAEVTAVDSTGKLEMLGAIGADRVIDYTQEDFTQNGQIYDVIFDVVGKGSFSKKLRSLSPGGTYLMANPRLLQMARGMWISRTGSQKIIFEPAARRTDDLNLLTELIEAGKLKPVIDRCFPLEQTAEAHRYVESGHKKGNLVITVASPNL